MIRYLGFVLLALILSGCNQAELLQKFTTAENQAYAKNYIDLLRKQQFEAVEKALDPSLQSDNMRDTLRQMSSLIPTEEPISITLVGAQEMNQAGVSSQSSTNNLTYEYRFSEKWLLINVAIRKQNDQISVIGFHINQEPTSLENQSKFSLQGKSFSQYLMLFLAIALPIFTLVVLVICIRTKLKGRKWPWILFILFGFGKLTINWTTGQWFFAPISIQLFSAGAFAPMYGAWILAVSIPIGAVAFLLSREKLKFVPIHISE